MGQVRISLSLSADTAEMIRTEAKRAKMTVSAYVELAVINYIGSRQRIRDIFAEMDEANHRAIEEAVPFTDEELAENGSRMPAAEREKLDAQLARALAASMRDDF